MSGIFYFGYGAMVNPISRKRRGVETVSEQPAVLDGFRLTFALGGAGNILRQRGWSVHGVVMECSTEKDWEKLKTFDTGYDCLTVDVYPYGSDDPILANVFVMAFDETENAKLPLDRLPQERYIRVIAQGMRFHGVDEDYVDCNIMNVPYIPNRKPNEYLRFEKKVKRLKKISEKEYLAKAEKNDWFRIGNRVIQIGPHDPQQAFCQWAHAKMIAKEDCTWVLLQTLYDPDLPVCESPQEVTPLHNNWAENQLVDKFTQSDVSAELSCLIKQPKKKKQRSFLLFPSNNKKKQETAFEKAESPRLMHHP